MCMCDMRACARVCVRAREYILMFSLSMDKVACPTGQVSYCHETSHHVTPLMYVVTWPGRCRSQHGRAIGRRKRLPWRYQWTPGKHWPSVMKDECNGQYLGKVVACLTDGNEACTTSVTLSQRIQWVASCVSSVCPADVQMVSGQQRRDVYLTICLHLRVVKSDSSSVKS